MLKSLAPTRTALLGGILAVLLGADFAHATEKQTNKSIYDRLGGMYPVAVVVGKFVDLLLVNDVVNANPEVKVG